ncbi:hypothetical protein [Flavobacterium granuli]|uniref:Uncharacterized protein n=1 Tax=Flavobacterium granuli TaxID=280093 RepID=A0ABU1S1H3_9FLAO|nr:hypothetical protein [Flavobacterium granuli]MDR6844500.1 hypothetical protein [Flavobacterium granuli]
MKTTFYIIGIVVFSAIMLSPKLPKFYPPKEVIEQRKEIVYKEIKLNKIISEIETKLAVDSVLISNK